MLGWSSAAIESRDFRSTTHRFSAILKQIAMSGRLMMATSSGRAFANPGSNFRSSISGVGEERPQKIVLKNGKILQYCRSAPYTQIGAH
jgi:hypothetical protein